MVVLNSLLPYLFYCGEPQTKLFPLEKLYDCLKKTFYIIYTYSI
jgi:hypothetical protein